MKHTFSHSFATRLSIYVFSFTMIVFATIMALFYNYNHEKVTSYAIERTHGLLSNIATEISSQLMSVETTINQSTWVLERNILLPRKESCQNVQRKRQVFYALCFAR